VTRGWIALFRSLGEALLGVVRAELAALQADLARSGRQVGVALLLFGGVAALTFWFVGLLIFTVVVALDIWLELWAAALWVLIAMALVGGALGVLGWLRLKKAENPLESARRRFDDHLDWWQNRLLASDTEEDER
jgi:uncharacterized membrane protein YqjE